MTKHYIEAIMQKVSSLEEELKSGNSILESLRTNAASIANEISSKTLGLHSIVGAIQAYNSTVSLLESGLNLVEDVVEAGTKIADNLMDAFDSITGQEVTQEPKE